MSMAAADAVSAGHSVYARARHIHDFSVIAYPKGISSPIADLLQKPQHYNRDFLLQFMDVCRESPDYATSFELLSVFQVLSPLPQYASHAKRTRTKGRGGIANSSMHTTRALLPVPTSSLAAVSSDSVMFAPPATLWSRPSDLDPSDQVSPKIVEQKVKALLDTLKEDNFVLTSDQTIGWMNELVIEEDERTLVQIINHIFEKASKEDTSSNVWANLCRKMMEQIRPRNLEGEGKLVNGGQLFRRYLQNFCQERMEAIGGGSLHTTTMPIANTEFSSVPLQSVDRRGLIRLMGELFKVRMLPERVMHEVIKRLLRNLEDPEEEDVESLCQLLCAIGSLLDTPKARSFMEIYIHRVQKLAQNTKVHPRLRTMLRDVLDLRERKWVPASAPRPVPKAGDLSQFGKIQKTTSMKDLKSRESTISRTNSTNAFSILQNAEQISEPPVITSKPSRPASRKPSVDIGPGGVPEAPMQRRKLNLLPRTVKAEEAAKDSPAASIVNSEDDTPEAGPPMSEEEVKQRINEDSKEFFSIRDLYEADVYFIKLPVEHRHKLVDKLISVAIESKATDAELVANFFTRAASKNYCSPSTFEEGFAPISELLDDIVYDSPKAFSLYAMMMKGAGLDKDEERRARLASKLTDAEKLLGLLS